MMLIWGFWAAAAAITVAVIALLLQALRRGDALADNSAALKVYRDQLAEVDRDLARSVISPLEADRVKTEVSRRLLDADRALKSAPKLGGKGSAAPAVALIALSLAAALAGYFWLGAPGYPDLPLSARLAMADESYRTRPSQDTAEAAAPAATPADVDPEFQDLMTKLRTAVEQRPDDTQGLALLAKNEAQLGNYIASRKAYEHLVDLKGTTANANDHAGLAQTMIAAAGGYVSPEAEKHLIRTLELDPTNALARYFSGLMFAQTGRPDRTFALWEPLLTQGPETAPWITPIRAGLQDIADAAGIKYQMLDARGPTAGDVAAAGEMSPEDRAEMIKSMVAQLEARLTTEGGPVDEWLKLINALGVLQDPARAKAALTQAQTAFKDNADALAQINAAAAAAGLTP
jgi:cytochrome c-type biogenesis protein CcmH